MDLIHSTIEGSVPVSVVVLLVAFFVLAKCAGIFVDNAVALARKLGVPKLIVGIVLVSLATTTPELSVSLMAALRGQAEMALGNAVGSVICDDGLALGLCGLVTAAPILILARVLKTSGLFLIAVVVLLALFVFPDSTLSRGEGAVLVALFVTYMVILVWQEKKHGGTGEIDPAHAEPAEDVSMVKVVGLFILALAGIIVASEFIVTSATTIARALAIPESVIAMTLVALGTSIPEVATCVTAARKGHGALAVGNIIGADIMNICWVAGASSIANDLTIGRNEIYFMFPWLFVFVGTMLGLLWWRHSMTRPKGIVMLALYALYLLSFFLMFSATK